MNYGLPYKGSKSKIADKIVGLFPQRRHLYDLFCGGGAITHYALTTHKFEDVFMNDVNWMCPTLFKNCLEGMYENEDRWISREEFYRLKHTDPYVAFVWSFGNNLRDYIYGREIEPFKKALHWVLYYRDNSLINEMGYDLSSICAIESMEERYLGIKRYFRALEITPPKWLRRIGELQHNERASRMREITPPFANQGYRLSNAKHKHTTSHKQGALQLEYYERGRRFFVFRAKSILP